MVAKETLNPFPGLRAFEEDEDYLFFGRERQVDDLLKKLRTAHFITVIGSSGSGKSSLVKCGLLPALHSGYMTSAGAHWRIAVLRPGNDPIGNLARTLAQTGCIYDAPGMEPTYASIIEATLRRSNLGLINVVKQSDLSSADNLLVVVDQFEELFRFNRYEKNAHMEKRDSLSFVDLLLNACDQQEVPVYVVITMRSDFIGDCTSFPGLPEAINRSQYLVPRMTREERKEAITGPIAVGGASITPRLLTHLLNDVGDNPDQLPILQHALMRTWHYWEKHHKDNEAIDLEHYQAIGTMTQALSRHAEEAYEELATERSKKLCEMIFKAITEKGSDRLGMRRPIRLSELCLLAEAEKEDIIAVIETFRKEGRSFLMPPPIVPLNNETIIDISHESLMRIWERLIRWVDEETQSAETYSRLAEAAALYQEARTGLWRNPELQLVIKWYEENKPNRYWARRYDESFERAIGFLKESKRREEFETLQKERQARQKIRRMRFYAVILGTAAFVSVLLLMIVMNLQVEAERNATLARESADKEKHATAIAEAEKVIAEEKRQEADKEREKANNERLEARKQQRIAELARTAEELKTQEAKQLSIEAVEARRKTEEALKQANASQIRAKKSEEQANISRMLALSRTLALQSLQEYRNNRELASLLALHAYRFSQDNGGELLNADIYYALAQIQAKEAQVVYDGVHTDAVRALVISPDGKSIISGSADRTVKMQRIGNDKPAPEILFTSTTAIRSLGIQAHGKYLAAGDIAGNILVFDLLNPKKPPVVNAYAHNGIISSLAITRNVPRLISAGIDGTIKTLDLDNPDAPPKVLLTVGQKINKIQLSPNGALLAVACDDHLVRIYDIRNPKEPVARLSTVTGRVCAMAFSNNGKYLATGSSTGDLFIWQGDNTRYTLFTTLSGHSAAISDMVFSPNDGLLATAGLDRTIKLWTYDKSMQAPVVLNGHSAWIWGLTFSTQGDVLFSAGEDRTIRAWVPSVKALAVNACKKITRELTPQEWDNYIGENIPYEKACTRIP